MKRAGIVGMMSLALLCVSAPAFADSPVRQAGNFGIGLGSSNRAAGLSMKYFMTGSQALQGTIGVPFGGNYIGLGADYLFELPALYSGEVLELGWSIGPGVGLGLGRDSYIGADAGLVAGLEFNFNPIPIDLVLEWRPNVDILPDFGLDFINFSGHLRYYF